MSTEAERQYLKALKGLLIVLVVVGHFGQTIVNNLPSNVAFIGQSIILFIYLFHMPLFLYVSGYLSKKVDKRRKRAFSDLFVPYILFQLFVGICLLILTQSTEALQNIFVPQMGAWYLLTVFIYRLVLPEIRKIKGILLIGVLLTVFTCLCTFDRTFALRKTLSLFVYFIAGYKTNELPRDRMTKQIARMSLVIFIIVFTLISWKTNWYSLAFSVLSKNASYKDFSQWYIAPIVYMFSFVASIIAMYLVVNSIPDNCNWLERQGEDTLPMYLSHLILFMTVGYLLNKNNWIITVGISSLAIYFSLLFFSADWYRSAFNKVLSTINKLLFDEN